MKREKKAKQDHGTVFSTLCMVLFGAALGIFAGKDLFEIVEGVSFGEYLLHVAWLIVMMTAAFYLQTILHEGGHLVCGLLTGYRFVSFRIGSWMVHVQKDAPFHGIPFFPLDVWLDFGITRIHPDYDS